MKQKLKIITLIFGAIMILLIGLPIISHITPSVAVRTKLLYDGHPIASITATIKYNAVQQSFDVDKLNRMNAKIYEIKNSEAKFENGMKLHNFIVKKVGYFYYASYWGEG